MKAILKSKNPKLDLEEVFVLDFKDHGDVAQVSFTESLDGTFCWPTEELEITCPNCGGPVQIEYVPEVRFYDVKWGAVDYEDHRILMCVNEQVALAKDGDLI